MYGTGKGHHIINLSLRDCFSLHFMFRYERVYPEEVCCFDDTEDRVIVGVGDSCCATIPYSSNGAQVCCNGGLKTTALKTEIYSKLIQCNVKNLLLLNK